METQKYSNRANSNAQQVIRNTSDKVCLKTEEINVTNTASALPFTGIQSGDVGSVIIKVKKGGSPADDTHIVRTTQISTDTPTALHGMWYGNGDIFEISNNANVLGFKIIATENLTHVATIEYYGK